MVVGRTLRQVGERDLLARIRRDLGGLRPGVLVDIGDDAAALKASHGPMVLSTDTMIENIDFRLSWASWSDLGRKIAAVNLSDLAAMGARPRALLVSVAVGADHRVSEMMRFLRALNAAGTQHGAPLVGGDFSRIEGPVVLTATALGDMGRYKPWRRGCGRSGDVVMVSGTVGDAAAGLALLEMGHRKPASLVRRQLRPEPRVSLAAALQSAACVRSAVDVSDGLARDAQSLPGPGCTVVLDRARLPLSPALRRMGDAWGRDLLPYALGGGEDFELLLAVPRRKTKAALEAAATCGVSLTEIGRVVRAEAGGVVGGRKAMGFDHFRASEQALPRV